MKDRLPGHLAAGTPQAPSPTSRHNHAADRAGGNSLVNIVVNGATVTGDLTGEVGDWHIEATDLHLGDDHVTFYSLLNDGRLRLDLSAITPLTTRLLAVPDVDGTMTVLGNTATGTGALVRASSPTITTPVIALNDADLTIRDNGDTSKQLKLEASGITTGTTRTVTAANASGTMGVYLKGTATWDPASLAAGAADMTAVTVTGAAVGDPVSIGFSQHLGFLVLTAFVSAADTVSVMLYNPTDLGLGTVNLASGTLTVLVWKA